MGLRRQLSALRDQRPDAYGFAADAGWNVHIEGACGEAVVAKVLNRYWNGSVDSFRQGGDVGATQVRTRSKHSYELIVRPDDRDEDAFVLVTGAAPSFRVVGYIIGRDAKRPEYLQTYGGRPAAYFVPHKELAPFQTGRR